MKIKLPWFYSERAKTEDKKESQDKSILLEKENVEQPSLEKTIRYDPISQKLTYEPIVSKEPVVQPTFADYYEWWREDPPSKKKEDSTPASDFPLGVIKGVDINYTQEHKSDDSKPSNYEQPYKPYGTVVKKQKISDLRQKQSPYEQKYKDRLEDYRPQIYSGKYVTSTDTAENPCDEQVSERSNPVTSQEVKGTTRQDMLGNSYLDRIQGYDRSKTLSEGLSEEYNYYKRRYDDLSEKAINRNKKPSPITHEIAQRLSRLDKLEKENADLKNKVSLLNKKLTLIEENPAEYEKRKTIDPYSEENWED